MYCQGCGNQIVSGATYCSQCGRPVAPQASTNYYPAGAPVTTSGLAIGALIMALIFPIVGLIMGYLARKEINNSQGRLEGQGLATASIVIGWIFTILGIFFIAIFITTLAMSSSYYW